MNRTVVIMGIVAALAWGTGPLSVRAQTNDNEAKVQNTEDQIRTLEAEIAQYQRELDKVSKEKKTIETEVNRIDTTSKKLRTDLRLTETQISNTDLALTKLARDIRTKEQKIVLGQEALKESLRNMHQAGEYSLIELVMSGEQFSDVWTDTNNLMSFQIEVHNWMAELEGTQQQLRSSVEEEEKKRIQLAGLKSSISYEKQAVDEVLKEKDSLLKQVEKEEDAVESIIAEKERLRKQFEAELTAFESEHAYQGSASSYPAPGEFTFAWPLSREIIITQPFGKTKDSMALYAYRVGTFSGQHTGIDFRANNDKVLAMADGVIKGLGNTDKTCPRASFGGWMLIDYGNGLSSIYSHLSLHVAKVGDVVTSGQVVAYSGNTGYSTGPHLDVKIVPTDAVTIETWPSKGCAGKFYTTPIVADSKYFDPLLYFPKATPAMYKK